MSRASRALSTAPSGESLGTSSAHQQRCLDPTKDTRLNAAFYGLGIGPDGMVWGSVLGFPGGIVRLNPGSNPPETALAEYYEVPWNDPKAPVWGFSPRGMDVDGNGVVWVALGSGHLASFDRTQVQRSAQRAEGHRPALPRRLDAIPDARARNSRTSRIPAARTRITTSGWISSTRWDSAKTRRSSPAISSDSLIALVNGKFVIMRVPYPLGFFAKGMDGRFDDPKTGWKGKGVWTTWGTRTPFHSETGKGTMPKVVHFQMRPDPLAN